MAKRFATDATLPGVHIVVLITALLVLACFQDSGAKLCRLREEDADTRAFLEASHDRQGEIFDTKSLDTRVSLYLAEMQCGPPPKNESLREDLAAVGDSAVPMLINRARQETQKYPRYQLLDVIRTMACRGVSIASKYPDAVQMARNFADSVPDDGLMRPRQLYEDIATGCPRNVIRPHS